MTDLSARPTSAAHQTTRRLRFVTAASLFDGHDASINIIRRMLMASGAEVIHLGHNRSVDEIVTAALQEDAHGIAVSSYQGGHIEFFKYAIDLLRERGGANIKLFGGGGGVIVPAEIAELHSYGVARIYSPEDGARIGLQGMIDDMLATANQDLCASLPASLDKLMAGDRRDLARVITALEGAALPEVMHKALLAHAEQHAAVPVLGVTGTGARANPLYRRADPPLPARSVRSAEDRGDRSRSFAPQDRRRTARRPHPDERHQWRQHLHALARHPQRRQRDRRLPAGRHRRLQVRGVRSGDRGDFRDRAGRRGNRPAGRRILVRHDPEYGAASQLEKIDMLDFADFVAINKSDRRGAEDALRDVSKQYQRNRKAFSAAPDQMPVFGTMAARFNDDGVTALYQAIAALLKGKGLHMEPAGWPR